MVSRSKKETWPQHKMGKHCGYELHEDGSIDVAPTYSDEMARIQEDKAVIDQLLKSTMRACEALMRPLVQQERELWGRMLDDYGLERGGGWMLEYRTLKKSVKKTA